MAKGQKREFGIGWPKTVRRWRAKWLGGAADACVATRLTDAPRAGGPGHVYARADLRDYSHRIRFHFTPKHGSWLNQIEIRFSILVRKLLRRASCNSKENLKEGIEAFVAWFNTTLAKPFKWTMTGKLFAGVPEPSTWALTLPGFAGLRLAGYRCACGKSEAPAPVRPLGFPSLPPGL